MLKPSGANRFFLPSLIVATVIIAGYAVQHTVSCFLLSFVLAYLLDPILVMLEKRRIRRLYGIIILYSILTLAAVFFFTYLVPFLSLRWESLVHNLPIYLQKVKVLAASLKEHRPTSFGTMEWQWLMDSFSANLDKLFAKLGTGVYSAASRVVFNLLNLLLAPILVFFMLFYKEEIKGSIASLLPANKREAILLLGREINCSVGGYLRGQLIVSIIVAILSAIALFYLDVDNALLNGIFAGIASLLPFVGVIIATIPPLFFAYIKFQSFIALVKVVAAFSVIYFVEGYVIKPLVFKGAMDLNPLITIIFVMAFGELLGFWGILLAIPIAAALKIFVGHLRRGDLVGES